MKRKSPDKPKIKTSTVLEAMQPSSVFIGGDQEIRPEDRVLGVWFIHGKRKRDWQATMWTCADGSGHRLIYRFRYYADDRAHDSEDRKSWFSAIIPPDEPEAGLIEKTGHIARELVRQGFNDRLDFIPVYGSPQKMLRLMSRRPWFHLKIGGAQEKIEPKTDQGEN